MFQVTRWSLARRQLVVLISSLSLAALLLGASGAWFINGFTERTSDRVLRASVSSIAETIALERGEISLEVPPGAFGMLEDSARDNVYYSVSAGGRLITGYRNFPAPDPSNLGGDTVSFRYGVYLGQPVRIATQLRRLPRLSAPVVVQVAETLDERRAQASSMLLGLAALEAVLVLLAALLIRPAIGWGLSPLARLEREIATREAGRLGYEPLATAEVPRELRGLVLAFNTLLARLDEAVARMRQFTADASHQMRTPLAVLKTHLGLVHQHGTASATGKSAVNEVDLAVDRLERLLSQLLGLARAEDEASAPRAGWTRFDLSAVAAETTRELAPRAVAAGIEIRFEPHYEPWIVCDPLIVSEILANLIDNAIRYNRPGGSVAVRTIVDARRPLVEVEDDGPGIPPEHREAVFQRFFRLTRDHEATGSGLGLPIVRSLALACSAEVSLHERKAGSGLIVRLSFRAQ